MSGTTHYFGDGHDHGPCPTCGHDWKPCPTCNQGHVVGTDIDGEPTDEPCPTCDGRGEVMDDDCVMICKTCDGSGKREFHVPRTKPPTWGLTSCPDCKGTGHNGHTTYGYGQQHYDGDACKDCAWQGPPNSANDHTTCPTCKGTGVTPCECKEGVHTYPYPCPDCKGTGTAAAPAVEGWVWCEEYGTPSRGPHAAKLVRIGPCPGPHHQLLLGPEVEA